MKIIDNEKEIILEEGDRIIISKMGSISKIEIKCSENAIPIDNVPIKKIYEKKKKNK